MFFLSFITDYDSHESWRSLILPLENGSTHHLEDFSWVAIFQSTILPAVEQVQSLIV